MLLSAAPYSFPCRFRWTEREVHYGDGGERAHVVMIFTGLHPRSNFNIFFLSSCFDPHPRRRRPFAEQWETKEEEEEEEEKSSRLNIMTCRCRCSFIFMLRFLREVVAFIGKRVQVILLFLKWFNFGPFSLLILLSCVKRQGQKRDSTIGFLAHDFPSSSDKQMIVFEIVHSSSPSPFYLVLFCIPYSPVLSQPFLQMFPLAQHVHR